MVVLSKFLNVVYLFVKIRFGIRLWVVEVLWRERMVVEMMKD